MMKLKLTNLTDHFRKNLSCAESTATIEHVTTSGPENSLDAACIQLCGEFPTLFESTLGCLKDFSLDIRFKPEAKPIFKKPRPVPFSILQDLNEAYEAGIKRGVWELTDFNSYGTPVVPIRKSPLPGQAKASIRVWRLFGDCKLATGRPSSTNPSPRRSNAQARTWLLL